MSDNNDCEFCEEIENLEERIAELQAKVEFYKQPCPEEREDGEYGYSQGEARFWHETAEKTKAERDAAEAELAKDGTP